MLREEESLETEEEEPVLEILLVEEVLGLEIRGSTKSSSTEMLRKGVSLVCPGQRESAEDEGACLVGDFFLF